MLPSGRHNSCELQNFPITEHELEGESLISEVRIGLPVGSPVPLHGCPPRRSPGRSLDPCSVHVATTSNVGEHHQIESSIPFQGEPNTAAPAASRPSKKSRNSLFKHTPYFKYRPRSRTVQYWDYAFLFIVVLHEMKYRITYGTVLGQCLRCPRERRERRPEATYRSGCEGHRTIRHCYWEGRGSWPSP